MGINELLDGGDQASATALLQNALLHKVTLRLEYKNGWSRWWPGASDKLFFTKQGQMFGLQSLGHAFRYSPCWQTLTESKKTPNQRTSASSNICTLSVSNTSLAGGALTDIDFNNFKNITRRHVATHHNRVDKGSNGAMVHLGSIQNRYA